MKNYQYQCLWWQLAAYIAKNDSGSFGCVVTSEQWAMLFWNSAGHLLHKTNPDLSYFKLSFVFWEHNDSVGRGTTVPNSN